MGLAETSTMEASPLASRWVRRGSILGGRIGDGVAPFFDDLSHLLGGVEFWFYKARGEPGEQAEKVVGDENLTVALRAGTDADGGDTYCGGEFFRDWWSNKF